MALVTSLITCAAPAASQTASSSSANVLAASLAEAERAFDREDVAVAERGYRDVLAVDPDQPRALFRLAQLRRGADPAAAAVLLERYVRIVPSDAWGFLALADAFARCRATGRAFQAYGDALALAPLDRDIQLGRARLFDRLGRTDAAIAAYETWLADNPGDGEVWRELSAARQRAGRLRSAADALEHAVAFMPTDASLSRRIDTLRVLSAPTVQVGAFGSGETDVQTIGTLFAVDVPTGDSSRVGALYRRRRVESFADSADVQYLAMRANARPKSDIHVSASGGVVWTRSSGSPEESRLRPDLALRIRRSVPAGGPIVDFRIQRDSIDATPDLVRVPVNRTQIGASADVPIAGPLRLRGQARIAALTRQDEDNRRTAFGGGIGMEVAPEVRLTTQWNETRNSNPVARGYFAPQHVQIADVGLEFEREWDRGSVALDAGGGIQRFQRAQQTVMGSWEAAVRVWGVAAWNIGARQQLLVEFETYDSHISNVVVVDTNRWRYASISASFRVALPSVR